MRNFLFFISLHFIFCACSSRNAHKPHIEIQTGFGDIEVELYADQAPKTVSAFLSYIDSGYFSRCSFYRVLNDENQPSNAAKTELIQGGIWKTNSRKLTSLKGIPHETTLQTKILHKNGVISLARLAPGSANTEFFICVGDQPGLDYGGENIADGQGYAAFGKVVKGMDVVRKIYQQYDDNQYFNPPVPIINITRE
jgi:peptidyl-prolyl cis-trans isomerase A (cyclophilin A)